MKQLRMQIFAPALRGGAMTAACALALVAGAASVARAEQPPPPPPAFDQPLPPNRSWMTPERMTLEFRIGPYSPSMGGNDAFHTFFSDDSGPLLALELDVIGYRLNDILYLNGGAGIGTAGYHGKTLNSSGVATSEDTSLNLVPLNLLAVARIDVLARKLSIPFIFTGKLGYQWMHWTTESGGTDQHSGWSIGLLWAAQIALDLDTFDRRAARTMDEEWGINHSFVFFEFFGFEPSGASLELGDHSWCAGLGFVF
jgi:opacity protein-like surface antigen